MKKISIQQLRVKKTVSSDKINEKVPYSDIKPFYEKNEIKLHE